MEIDCHMLLKQVQLHECVYNPRSSYKNLNTREEAWEEICKAMVAGWDTLSQREKSNIEKELKRKWKCLKDAYVRCLRNRKKLQGTGVNKVRPYLYEREMAFLKNCITFKHDPQAESTFYSEPNYEDNDSDDLSASDVDSTPRPHSPGDVKEENPPPPDPPAKKMRREGALETPESGLPASAHQAVSSDCCQSSHLMQVVSSVSLAHEEDKMFLLSLLPQLAEMSAMEKLDFKINVLKLIKTSVENKEKNTFGRC